MLSHRRIALAVDTTTTAEAQPLVERLAPHVGVLKVGLELFCREGPSTVTWARRFGLDVFLDLKLHDIPETVDRAVAAVCATGARYVTLHAQGGAKMVERAVRRAEAEGGRTLPLFVTVLTSLGEDDLLAQGVTGSPEAQVVRLAGLAWSAGARGFVTSAREVGALRGTLGRDAFLVTPGIRPAGSGTDDQKRTATPRAAIAEGADLLVVGRPLRDAADPVATARAIADDITAGLAS